MNIQHLRPSDIEELGKEFPGALNWLIARMSKNEFEDLKNEKASIERTISRMGSYGLLLKQENENKRLAWINKRLIELEQIQKSIEKDLSCIEIR